jgi:tetratricopeptide (TPR) repeat protein
LILATLDGRLEEVPEIADRALARVEEIGQRGSTAAASTRALLYLGRAEEALAARVRWAPGGRVCCLAYLGRRAEAQAELESVLAQPLVRTGEASAAVLTWLLEAAVLLEDREAAAVLADGLAGASDTLATGTGEAATCVARHLGAAAALLGDREAARARYQTALEITTRTRFRPEIALTRLGMAELLLNDALTPTPSTGSGQALSQGEREQRRAEARAHLDFAIAEFRDMKMQPSLERALRCKELLSA